MPAPGAFTIGGLRAGLTSRGRPERMLRVRARPLLAAALVAGSLAMTAAVAVPVGAAVGPRTRVVEVSPTTSAGTLRAGYTVVQSRHGASCEAGSDVISGVYRCFSGNDILDPCWAETVPMAASQVVCLLEPWSHEVTRLYLSSAPEASPPGRLYVWGVQLTTGQRCLAAQGTHALIHGQVVNYYCGPGYSHVLVGEPDRSRPVWRIREARLERSGDKLGSFVAIATAWYGMPSAAP